MKCRRCTLSLNPMERDRGNGLCFLCDKDPAPASTTERDPARLLAALDAMTRERDAMVCEVERRVLEIGLACKVQSDLRARLSRVAALPAKWLRECPCNCGSKCAADVTDALNEVLP